MATLAISPIPHSFNRMAARRIPLSDVPNAANSPAKHVNAYKRSRDQAEAQEKLSFDTQPRAKRQVLEGTQLKAGVSPARQRLQQREDRVFTKPATSNQPTAFERRLLAARENGAQQRVHRPEKISHETLEGVRLWQKHYKKAFPQFVFYFEGIPEDVRTRCSRTVRNLGAREEKFFSKEVTHVVTTRSIPSHADSKDDFDTMAPSTSAAPCNQSRTINPSLLDRPIEFHGSTVQTKSKFNFEPPNSRRTSVNGVRESEPRKGASSSVDILSRAQDLGMKVWQLEKLQRIMSTMFDLPSDSQGNTAQQHRTRLINNTVKLNQDADLSRMLRNERLHGPSDRDVSVSLNEIVPFKGPYIYVRDIDERTKPIMVKEWSKPAKKGDAGEWPQFRAVSHGKCPFVEEINKEDLERELAREEEILAQVEKVESRSVSQSRNVTPHEIYEDDDDHGNVSEGDGTVAGRRDGCEQPLQEIPVSKHKRYGRPEKPMVPQFCPPPSRLPNQVRSPLKAPNPMSPRGQPQMIGAEPAASGLQPSNITSAIRSQMISSTAAGPGLKAGTSKEVHGLKRKVLEKNAGPALNKIQARQHKLDHSTNARAESQIPHVRQINRHVRETLVQIHEESTQSEEDEDVWLADDVRTREPTSKKTHKKKDGKPGYCENCREKYADFDDHISDRKHRKFALNLENWRDLDRLLARLARPLKETESNDF